MIFYAALYIPIKMKCLSFAHMILLVIVMSVLLSFQTSSIQAYGGAITSCIVLWWLAGYFMKCD